MRQLPAKQLKWTVDCLDKLSRNLAVIERRSQRSIVATVGMHEGEGGTSYITFPSIC